MDFEKYDKIINENKYDMTFLFIYYNLKVNDNLQLDYINIKSENIKKQINTLISIIYEAYMKDENHLDLGFICDKAVENKNEILNNTNFSKWDLLEECYNSI